MAVSAISNLSTWLSQVNGTQSQNLSAKSTSGSAHSTGASQTGGSSQLAALFENLLQQLVAAGGTASAAAGTAATAATGSPSGVGATTGAAGATGAATSASGLPLTQSTAQPSHGHGHLTQQMALNQLLQEIKLGSSSTTKTAASTATSAQGTSSQQLLSQLQQLMHGATSSVGSIVSALV